GSVVVPADRVGGWAALSVALVRAGRIGEARRLYVLGRSVAVATRRIWQPEVLAALATVAYAVGDVAEAKALAYNITKCEWIHVRDPLGVATDVVTRIGGSYQRMIIRILKRRLHSDS